MNRYMTGMITGVMIGVTVGMMMLPQLDRKTQRTMKRAGQRVIDMAEDSMMNIRGMRY